MEEGLLAHRYHRRAAAGAIRCYLALLDKPKETASTEEPDYSNMTAAQRKREKVTFYHIVLVWLICIGLYLCCTSARLRLGRQLRSRMALMIKKRSQLLMQQGLRKVRAETRPVLELLWLK